MDYVYPEEFTQKIKEMWSRHLDSGDESAAIEEPTSSAAWLALGDLEPVVSTCYQASLQRDEKRIINFRLILCSPAAFDGVHAQSYGILPFESPRPFTDEELRRLAPAADFYRSLMGVHRAPSGELVIWGLIHSGPEWVQVISGGRGRFQPLPNWPVVSVLGPGRLSAGRGSFTLATLRAGRMERSTLDIFDSEWLPAVFTESRLEVSLQHDQKTRERGGARHQISQSLPRSLGQHAIRRMISLMRQARHGGTILFLPSDYQEIPGRQGSLKVKYPFAKVDSRLQFRKALLNILEFLACDYHPEPSLNHDLNWNDYVHCEDKRLVPLDQKLFEFAHLVSEVSRVDGAVVLNKRFELLGFGAEISHSSESKVVRQALDADGSRTQEVSLDNFGTRHRSAFRFCEKEPEALVVVVSQDATVFIVKNHEGRVTFWNQISVSALDI